MRTRTCSSRTLRCAAAHPTELTDSRPKDDLGCTHANRHRGYGTGRRHPGMTTRTDPDRVGRAGQKCSEKTFPRSVPVQRLFPATSTVLVPICRCGARGHPPRPARAQRVQPASCYSGRAPHARFAPRTPDSPRAPHVWRRTKMQVLYL